MGVPIVNRTSGSIEVQCAVGGKFGLIYIPFRYPLIIPGYWVGVG